MKTMICFKYVLQGNSKMIQRLENLKQRLKKWCRMKEPIYNCGVGFCNGTTLSELCLRKSANVQMLVSGKQSADAEEPLYLQRRINIRTCLSVWQCRWWAQDILTNWHRVQTCWIGSRIYHKGTPDDIGNRGPQLNTEQIIRKTAHN